MTARRLANGFKQLLLALATLVALVPLYVMLSSAFKTQDQFLSSPFSLPLRPSLGGFRTALNDQFVRWFANSAILTGGSVVVTLAVASFAAWGFAHWRFRGRDLLLGVLVSLMVVPPVVLLVPLFVFGVRLGLISTYQLVILIYVGLMLPFSVYMLTNFFRTIPGSLVEAAIVDGASSWSVFRRVVLPLSRAPLVTLAVVNLLWAWNELLIALVFLRVRLVGPGDVHQHVERADEGLGLCDEGPKALGRVTQVAHERADGLGQAARGLAVHTSDVGALGGEALGDGPADAVRRPGDQRATALEQPHRDLLSDAPTDSAGSIQSFAWRLVTPDKVACKVGVTGYGKRGGAASRVGRFIPLLMPRSFPAPFAATRA